MLSRLQKNWQLIFVNLAVIVFFARLFFPPSTFTTPDFGRTDILHIALPDKLIESGMLRGSHFSFWENSAGYGYPFLPEAVGSFFIPNLIIFFLFPLNFAIPLMFLTTFLIAANSMYYLLIKLNLEKLSAAFGALAFAFSAAMILRIPHIAVAQAISIVPLAIAFNISLLKKIDKKTGILLAIVLSQILVTFTQIYVYLILLIMLLNFLYFLFDSKKRVIKFFLIYSVIIFFSLILGSSQLFASYEGLKQSQRGGGINPETILSGFPLRAKNLYAFLNPFIVGKASNGSYNNINWAENGIYWESTPYIGLLPFLFSITTALYVLKTKQKKIYIFVLIVATASLTLALGKAAPLHILFSFPPLSFFRVPARFIIFTQIFLIILAAYGFDTLFKKFPKLLSKAFPILLLALLFDFYSKWWNYHPIENLKSLKEKPQILNILKTENIDDSRFYSIETMKQWNDVFTNSGWENKADYYKFFRNSLDPNLNIIYGINHFSSYQVLPSKRQSLQQSIIPSFTQIDNNEINFQDTATKALNIFSIKYLVTTVPIKNPQFEKLGEVTKDKYKFMLYENKNVNKTVNFYYNYKPIVYISDYVDSFQKEDLEKTVTIENFPETNLQKGENQVQIDNKNSDNYKLTVSTTTQGLLVLSDSFSKGWKAKIDGKLTKIYAANINSKAILVPSGNHRIEFYYLPTIQLLGILISIFAYLASVKILLKRN